MGTDQVFPFHLSPLVASGHFDLPVCFIQLSRLIAFPLIGDKVLYCQLHRKKMLTLLQLLKIIIPASTILSAGGSFPRHGEIQQQIIVRGHIIITTSSSHDQCFEAIVSNTVEVWSGRPEDVAKIVECC